MFYIKEAGRGVMDRAFAFHTKSLGSNPTENLIGLLYNNSIGLLNKLPTQIKSPKQLCTSLRKSEIEAYKKKLFVYIYIIVKM